MSVEGKNRGAREGETLSAPSRVRRGAIIAASRARAPDGGAAAGAPVLERHGKGGRISRENLESMGGEVGGGQRASGGNPRDGEATRCARRREEIRGARAPCWSQGSGARTLPPRRWSRGAPPAEDAWWTASSRRSLCAPRVSRVPENTPSSSCMATSLSEKVIGRRTMYPGVEGSRLPERDSRFHPARRPFPSIVVDHPVGSENEPVSRPSPALTPSVSSPSPPEPSPPPAPVPRVSRPAPSPERTVA